MRNHDPPIEFEVSNMDLSTVEFPDNLLTCDLAKSETSFLMPPSFTFT